MDVTFRPCGNRVEAFLGDVFVGSIWTPSGDKADFANWVTYSGAYGTTGAPCAVAKAKEAIVADLTQNPPPPVQLLVPEAPAAPRPEPPVACPGPDCWLCNGEACLNCGAGLGPSAPYCEHDVIDRHTEPEPVLEIPLCADSAPPDEGPRLAGEDYQGVL